MDQRTWTVKLIFTPCQVVQWSLTSVTRCGELLQLSSDTCECVNYFGGIFEGMTLLNSCQVLKSWHWFCVCCGTFNWWRNSSWNREWDTETFLHLSTLFPRIEWIFQENLQVHASTSVFQRSQHPEIHADAPKGQDLQWPKEGSSLPPGV